MKAISLWQPWASLVALSEKRIETRSWPTSHRGAIAIHAAKRWTHEEQEIAGCEFFIDVLRKHGYVKGNSLKDISLPLGCIIATADLVECKSTNHWNRRYDVAEWVEDLSEQEDAFGNYDSDRFGWFFEDIQLLPNPIPYKGSQGLFEVPHELFLPTREHSSPPLPLQRSLML